MISKFLKERIGITPAELKDKIDEKVPTALAREFFFALGGIPMICFFIQFVTGLILGAYYMNYSGELANGLSATYISIRNITYEFPVLNYVRGVHQLGANIMIVSLFLHMLRVFFTESYRKPRELVWVCGMLLFFTTLGLGFTGYALVGDQLSYWATQVGTNIAAATPVIGPFIKRLMLGGTEINLYTMPRFFLLHVMVLPLLVLTPLIMIHLFLAREHGISYTGGKEKSYYSLVPNHIFNEYKILWVLICAFVAIVYFFPPTLGEPANPFLTPEHIKPEWYFFPMFHFLKLVPFKIGILATMGVFAAMTLWPFIQTVMETVIPHKIVRVIAFTCGTILMIVCMVFTVLEALA